MRLAASAQSAERHVATVRRAIEQGRLGPVDLVAAEAELELAYARLRKLHASAKGAWNIAASDPLTLWAEQTATPRPRAVAWLHSLVGMAKKRLPPALATPSAAK